MPAVTEIDENSYDYVSGLPNTAKLTHRQAAVLCKRSVGWLYNQISAGQGPKLEKEFGGSNIYVKADVLAWFKQNTQLRPAYSRRGA